jgi:hypothetical protein
LPFDVDLTHVDGALEAELGRHRRGGHAVLSRSRLGDHAPLSEALHEQTLAHHVVCLVGASVIQIFALDVDARAAKVLRQVFGEGEGSRSARVGAHQVHVLRPEGWVRPRRFECQGQLFERRVQDFGHVRAAEALKIASFSSN